jgi:hypothetical protein
MRIQFRCDCVGIAELHQQLRRTVMVIRRSSAREKRVSGIGRHLGGLSMIRGKIHAAAYLARRRGRDRRAGSPGAAVGVRLGAGIGVNEEDCKQIIASLERDRLIDYVNVSIGTTFGWIR